jgi:hypothetical protein
MKRGIEHEKNFSLHRTWFRVSRFVETELGLGFHFAMIRIASSSLYAAAFAAALCVSGAVMAQTAKKPAAAAPTKPAAAPAAAPSGQPATLGTFGNWGAFASDTPKGRVCYALSQPKERLPANLNRDPAFIFISTRPSENVRNEVSFVLGFPPKEGGEGQLTVGKTNYVIKTQADTAWLKNPADDAALVELLKKTPNASLKITSRRGNQLTDNYVTNGLTQALEQVKKACP